MLSTAEAQINCCSQQQFGIIVLFPTQKHQNSIFKSLRIP